MPIDGHTRLIAHIGYPTSTFKAPLIYNPWFEARGINAVVMPMGVRAADFTDALATIRRFSNFHGALITMPHKVTTLALMDATSTAAKIAGACNAILLRPDGSLLGDMFDGEGFVRGVLGKGFTVKGASALVVGSGGVGSAIAASLAGAGIARLGLFDVHAAACQALAERLAMHYPTLTLDIGTRDPAGYDIVVNATPLGMTEGDPLPVDVDRIGPTTFVGEVVMKQALTPLLLAARARGCTIQIGTDMLFEQIPAYLDFFGFGQTTADDLRAVAQIRYT